MGKTEPFSRLRIPRSTPPMEARSVDALPDGDAWQFEPKWDGFRCLAFRDGKDVALMSKSGKPLERYFPELAAMLRDLSQDQVVLDGEIVLPVGDALSFAALQARLHPAASRIAKLSAETPAQLVMFDCLQLGDRLLMDEPLDSRRGALERFSTETPEALRLSPFTYDRELASAWLARTGGALDGVVAKRRDESYQPGERAMFKRKLQRTADCVAGGFRRDKSGTGVGSLLLGLYDAAGLLNYVGFTSSFSADQRRELLELLEPNSTESAFTGSAPGGVSRWSKPGQSHDWTALGASQVAEVGYDQVTGGRFRHGTTFLRWRPDKAPGQCTTDQLAAELRPDQLEQLLRERG
jgi:ATP-dependent DNA ligase